MLQFVLGTAGSGKTWYVRNLIAEKVKSGERGIMLLVPEQNNYESERAMLRLLGSASTEVVEVASFTLLARNIAQVCGSDALRTADDGIKMLMMGRALRSVRGQLTVYGKSEVSKELCSKFLDFYTELKRSAVTNSELLQSAGKLSGAVSNKIEDISTVLGAYEGLLKGRFNDPLDDLLKLDENLNSIEYFKDRTVVIDAFKGFTEQQYRILSHIIRQAREIYVTVCADSLHDGDEETGVFSNNKAAAAHILQLAHDNNVTVAPPITVNTDKRFNGTVLRSVESLMRGGDPVECEGGELTVCACLNSYDEADYVARTVRRMVRTQGYRYRDFAVIARDIGAYRNLLVDAFERYNVACFSDMRTDAGSLALFRFVLNAISCAAFGFRGDAVMQCVKSVLSGISVEEASLVENYALIWNISGSEWTEEWTKNPDGLEEKFDRDLLRRINSVRERAVLPLQKLSAELSSGDVRTVCRGIYDFLISVGADKNLARYADEFEARGEFYSANIHRKSWSTLMSCLDNAVRVFDGDVCDKREFCDLFQILLNSCDIGAIPDRLDEVVLGSADRIRAGNPRITFVIGANYSVFPRPVGKGSLLSLAERKSLIDAGIAVPDYENHTAVDEQFFIYSALCTPSEGLYITYHTSSVSGGKSMPAEFVGKILDGIPQAVHTVSADSERDRFEGVLPSVELVSTEKYRPYADALREQLLQRGIAQGSISLNGPDSSTSEIKPENALRLFGENIKMSASRVETYARCPFSFFCKFGLSARPVRSAELDVMRRGTLIHYVLEKSVFSHGRELSQMTAEQRMSEISELLHEYSDKTLGGYDSLDKGFLFMLDRIALLIDRLLSRIGEEMSVCDFTPDKFELNIGGDEIDAVTVPLDNGSVTLTGLIDRVDVYRADGRTYVRIVDYKTGSKQFDLSDIFYGMNMQMLIYLFAVVSSGMYENAVPAGVLYMPSKRPIHSVDRGVDDSKLSGMDDDKLRMNGLLLDDTVSLSAMEQDGAGRFIPYFPNSRRATSYIADKNAFDALNEKVKNILRAVGDCIHSGKVCAEPTDPAGGDACKYCDYASVCLRDDSDVHKSVEKLSLSQALLKLTGGDIDGV